MRRSTRIAKLNEGVEKKEEEKKVMVNKRTRGPKKVIGEEKKDGPSDSEPVPTKKKKKQEKENKPREETPPPPPPPPQKMTREETPESTLTDDPALEVTIDLPPERGVVSPEPTKETYPMMKKSPLAIERPRRSVASRVSYIEPKNEALDDEMVTMSSSSSSEEDASSADEMQYSFSVKTEKERAKRRSEQIQKPSTSKGAQKSRKKVVVEKKKVMSSSSSSESFESEDSDSEVEMEKEGKGKKGGKGWGSRKKPTGKEKDEGDSNWPKCRKASIARKTGNPSNSGKTKEHLRMAVRTKPDQPWKKNLKEYEQDRKLAKGERRMLEYRLVAEIYARGKIEAVSYDECFKVHEEMKKAYHEGRKIIDAVLKEEERVAKKEREEETGEKESSSEDEWEELEQFEPVIDDNIELMLQPTNDNDSDDGEVMKDWWVVYLRQEVNKRIRMVWEDTHKVHLLCYMIHLNTIVKTSLDERLVPSLMISHLPSGYMKYVGETVPVDVMRKLIKWFADAFRPLNGIISVTAIEEELKEGQEARYPATSRLSALCMQKCFETDLDRAVLLFTLLVGMECTARICVNTQPIARKWDKEQQAELQKEMDKFKEASKSRSVSVEVEKEKDEEKKVEVKKGGKKKVVEKKVVKKKKTELRNYWVEYWHSFEKRWICIDPLHKTVDEPLKIWEDAAAPITYVFAIDNKRGICEISQRYAMDCVKQDFRRRRTDPKWLAQTLQMPIFAADHEKRQLEKLQLHQELVQRPLPTTMSEYKNHPLYVLEKDLLKFEAIYPPPSKQKPLGEIRGHKVYPRSCVYTLQGENNWLKLARSVKIGEKAYKVVKARPDFRIPAEDRVDTFLDVFGYWQTEPYRRPVIKNGKIPRNAHGNVYMFTDGMCPIGGVHLKLPGLVQIARKLDKECAQAVVGWAFDGGFTHPVMDGAIVLEKDAAAFRKEWQRMEAGKAAREEKKRLDRIYENWRKLIKGKLRLTYVQKKFKSEPQKKKEKKEEEDDEEGMEGIEEEDEVIDNTAAIRPLDGFSLDDFIKNKK